MEEWMDGLVDGRLEEIMNRRDTDGWRMDELMGEWMGELVDGWIEERMDGWMSWWKNGCMTWWIDVWKR